MAQSFRVVELDFDTIKNNLKTFISSKPTFTDYDFEGSGLSIMLDVLAYNTHYNAIIANMLTQEMFLETAAKRETVNLHAKKLGYLPRSMRAARANVSVEVFPTDAPDTITLGKNAVFYSGGEIKFTFTNTNSITTTRNSVGRYIFDDIQLYEGRSETFRYVVGTNSNRFQIPTKNADISLLKVFVQENETNTNRLEYTRYESIVDISSDSTAYFLNINQNGYYEVYFGDNVIGKSIESGQVVTLEYVVCNGELPNGAGQFRVMDSIQGYSNISTTTLTKAFGGSQQESISAIKENAYKRLLTQNRAVCYTDFKPIIQDILPVGDIVVWGGENNTPPVYGKVFISVLNQNVSQTLTSVEKQYLLSELKKKMLVTVSPEIVDPDLLYIEIFSSVYFDQNKTSNSASQIKTLVLNSITEYISNKLNMFSTELRHSNLGTTIDLSDKSINSNITKYVLKKSIVPVYNKMTNYQIDFKNPIRQSSDISQSVSSNGFYVDGTDDIVYIDDSYGIIRLYKNIDGLKVIIKNIGTINYTTGIIKLVECNITSTIDGNLIIKCLPVSNDIVCSGNTALVVNGTDVLVNIISESQLSHTFTSSI